VFAVVLDLFFAAVLGDRKELLDALGLDIGVEDDLAVEMAGGATGRLDEAGGAAEVTFLVGVQDGDERDFREIEAFAEEVDTDEHVELAFAEGAEDFDPFDGVDFAVEVANVDADIAEVIGEFLGGAFGEGGDEDAFVLFDAFAGLLDEVVDLAPEGFDSDLRIDKASGTDDEFSDLIPGPFQFAGAGSGAYVEGVVLEGLEFGEAEGAVVEGAGETEAVFDEDGFAGEIAGVHAADLGDGGVGFVDDEEVILGKEIEEDMGSRAGRPAGQMSGIIFDAGAEAHFEHHFEVIFGARFNALGFEEFAAGFEPGDAFGQFLADGEGCPFDFVHGGDELFGRIDGEGGELLEGMAGKGIEAGQTLELVSEELEAEGVLGVSRAQFDGIAADAELAAFDLDVVTVVLEIDESFEELFAGDFLADADGDDHGFVVFLAADAVDAGDAGDDDHVLAGEERAHGREPEALDLVVDARVFLDEGVGPRDVSLGLVIIEIADEVFDGVAGEETLELGVKLRREGFVMGDDEGGLLDLVDDVGDGVSFAGTGHAQQRLVLDAGAESGGQAVNGLGLISSRFVRGNQFKHGLAE
jgi:hypothetical protein